MITGLYRFLKIKNIFKRYFFVRNGGGVGCVFGLLVLDLERGLRKSLAAFLVDVPG
jgi:hypothetical protein